MFVFIAITLLQIPMLLLSHPGGERAAKSFVVPHVAGRDDLRCGVADHRHRRHHRGALAAVLPAVQHRRQTHHPPLHRLRTRRHRPRRRRRRGRRRRDRDDRRLGRPLHQHSRAVSPTPAPSPHLLGGHSGVLGSLFAIVLLDASIIGAAAVTLATSYAFGDVFGLKHSLHRSFARRQTVLPVLLRDGRGRRGDRAHPRRPARVDHHRRAGTGRTVAAQRQRVSAAVVQRPRSAGAVGEPALAQRASPASSSVCC